MRKVVLILALLMIATPVYAVKVADITRLEGQRTDLLTGLGLVVGLKGSGDGGQFAPAIKPLAAMLAKNFDPATAKELANAQNVAVVNMTVHIGKNGARKGDRLDVYVTSFGAASSLKGGRLFVTPLQGAWADNNVWAMAEGPVVLEDPSVPTVGVIKGGAIMEADIPRNFVDDGKVTFVLDDPSADWTTASTIAKVINESEAPDGQTLAIAADPKTIVVMVPKNERERPDSFISRVQRLPVPMLPTEARVQINDRTGTMIITGDVEISPVVISHKGLTISTILPPMVPTLRNPVVERKGFVTLDTTNQGGAKLQDLVNALEQLKVSSEDRITIVKELHKTGKLHAKLILE
jgi:flagellar P-ring protein FlgI